MASPLYQSKERTPERETGSERGVRGIGPRKITEITKKKVVNSLVYTFFPRKKPGHRLTPMFFVTWLHRETSDLVRNLKLAHLLC